MTTTQSIPAIQYRTVACTHTHSSKDSLAVLVDQSGVRGELILEVLGGGEGREVVGELHEAAIGHPLLDEPSENLVHLEGGEGWRE